MNHVSYEEWLRYVKNELNEDVREGYDQHLYHCDPCLELYLEAVENAEILLPELEQNVTFTDEVMKKVVHPQRKMPFYQKTLFHYSVAAAMTLLFMTSGIFQSITNFVDSSQSVHFEEQPPSVTEEILDKTFTWMDSIQWNHKEAKQ